MHIYNSLGEHGKQVLSSIYKIITNMTMAHHGPSGAVLPRSPGPGRQEKDTDATKLLLSSDAASPWTRAKHNHCHDHETQSLPQQKQETLPLVCHYRNRIKKHNHCHDHETQSLPQQNQETLPLACHYRNRIKKHNLLYAFTTK